jgi:hypothetical protein
MNYSMNLLTTQADCDTLLSFVTKDRKDLEYRRLGLERKVEDASDSSSEIEAELQSTNAELAALESFVATLPDGPTKEETHSKITRLKYRQFLLQERKDNYGTLSLIDKEYDMACIDRNIIETNELIAAVEARKAQL